MIKQRLAEQRDEVAILELLDIHADELVEAFDHKIADRADELEAELFEPDEPVEE